MKDDERARAITADFRTARLSGREMAILEYAEKLTLTPPEMEKADIDRLREAGLSDAEVLDVCQVTAYFNYVNRLADGLGVELEPYWDRVRE